ncbi:MAG: hypothetical protein RTU30_07020 [Candidatus Thorarchaeota archaeon]
MRSNGGLDTSDAESDIIAVLSTGITSNVIMLQNVGWYYCSSAIYSTSTSEEPPIINLSIQADVI